MKVEEKENGTIIHLVGHLPLSLDTICCVLFESLSFLTEKEKEDSSFSVKKKKRKKR